MTRRRVMLLHLGVVSAFSVMAVLTWWHVWAGGHPGSTIVCQCGDVSEGLSFLAWTPWAVSHGHNPFFTNAMLAGQGGANMLVNTSFMAWALLFAPVTWLFGPIATFNVVVTLAPVVSGWCFFLAVRSCTRFVPGQIAAAALYGFSPIVVTNEPVGHFFQIWLFYPPLAFLCLRELFITRRRSPAVVGIAFGLLTVVQFFTSTEVLVITVLCGGIGALLGLAVAPRVAWRERRHILTGLGMAGAVTAAFLAYPAWYALGGPQHIVGAAWGGITALWGSAPLAFIEPGNYRAVVPLGYNGPGGPPLSFVGYGVVAFVGVSAVVWWRNRLAWVVAAMAVCSWALSLGTFLIPIRPSTDGIWLPWRVVGKLPILGQVIPVRIALIVTFSLALLLALSADAWWQRWTAVDRRRRTGPDVVDRADRADAIRWLGGAALSALAVLALVPLAMTFSFPYVVPQRQAIAPAWFTQVAPRLPAQTELLVYPYPDDLSDDAMGWQAVDAFHFRMVGGFLIVPGQDGTHSMAVSRFTGARRTLDQLTDPGFGELPPAAPGVVSQMRGALERWGVQDVVVVRQGRDPVYALAFFTAVLGRAPVLQQGSWVWYGLGTRPPLRIAAETPARCEATAFRSWSDPSVARCVLGGSAA